MAGRRVHFVMSEELVARIDAALSDGVSRGEFVRRAVERALGAVERTQGSSGVPERMSGSRGSAPASASAEQPSEYLSEDQPSRTAWHRDRGAGADEVGESVRTRRVDPVRSSGQAKRDVRPVPKKGER